MHRQPHGRHFVEPDRLQIGGWRELRDLPGIAGDDGIREGALGRTLEISGFSNHMHPDKTLGRVDLIYLDPHTADVLIAGAQSKEIFTGLSRGMASSPASKTSSAPAAGLELSLETSAADSSAPRAASANKPVARRTQARFLAQFRVSQAALRARRGPGGSERFTL